eukprot:UN01473
MVIIKKHVEHQNKLLKWISSTTRKVTNAVEKEALRHVVFPEDPAFVTYHLFRTATIKMYTDQYPHGIELVFIGAGAHWFLNPLQQFVLSFEDHTK